MGHLDHGYVKEQEGNCIYIPILWVNLQYVHNSVLSLKVFLKASTGLWYTYPSEKYELVSWDDEIPNIWKNRSHVPNHQPVNQGVRDVHFPSRWDASTHTSTCRRSKRTCQLANAAASYISWCPSSLAKLVHISPISLGLMVDISN